MLFMTVSLYTLIFTFFNNNNKHKHARSVRVLNQYNHIPYNATRTKQQRKSTENFT